MPKPYSYVQYASLVFKGEPLTKANALSARQKRFSKLKFYIPERIKNYEAALRDAAAESYKGPAYDLPIRLEITYYLGSKRRKDVGNLVKTTADALNQIFFHDDNNIVDLILAKKLDTENPRTEIVAYVILGVDSSSTPYPLVIEDNDYELFAQGVEKGHASVTKSDLSLSSKTRNDKSNKEGNEVPSRLNRHVRSTDSVGDISSKPKRAKRAKASKRVKPDHRDSDTGTDGSTTQQSVRSRRKRKDTKAA
jgi:Holliday junction resolvase RusA-like endonuclease